MYTPDNCASTISSTTMMTMTARAIFARRDSNIAGRDGRIDNANPLSHSLDSGSTYRPGLQFRSVRKDGRVLDSAVADIEAHVHAGGWDRTPLLFALVRAD